MSANTYYRLPVNDLAQTLKLLAEPSRLRILCSLGLECRPVTDIIRATGMEQTNVSFHLRLLREAGLLRAEPRGPFVYYCLPDPELLNILVQLNAWVNKRQQGEGMDAASEKQRRRASLRKPRAHARPPKQTQKVSRTSKVNA